MSNIREIAKLAKSKHKKSNKVRGELLEALEKKVDDNIDSIAFSIFPTQIDNVIEVADKNLTMPPKSTWFDPKPLDGLVVYEFNQ